MTARLIARRVVNAVRLGSVLQSESGEKEKTVLKKILLGVSCAALSASLVIPVFAAAPVKISTVAPTGDLVAEIGELLKSLEEALASNDAYLQAKATTIPTEAGVLAVLAQAVVDAEDKAGYKGSAADLRDAAKAIADSKTYDDAKQGLAAAKEANGGKKGSAKAEHEWNKLVKLGSLMKDVNKRNGKLRRAVRKLPTTRPKPPATRACWPCWRSSPMKTRTK
jgi:hypothetical protein